MQVLIHSLLFNKLFSVLLRSLKQNPNTPGQEKLLCPEILQQKSSCCCSSPKVSDTLCFRSCRGLGWFKTNISMYKALTEGNATRILFLNTGTKFMGCWNNILGAPSFLWPIPGVFSAPIWLIQRDLRGVWFVRSPSCRAVERKKQSPGRS